MMELLIAACIIGLIPAFIAASKGQSFFGWWMYGAALFIVALPHSLLIQKDDWTRFTWGEAKTCPFCAELVRREARICRFCGLEFPPVRQEDPETRQRLWTSATATALRPRSRGYWPRKSRSQSAKKSWIDGSRNGGGRADRVSSLLKALAGPGLFRIARIIRGIYTRRVR